MIAARKVAIIIMELDAEDTIGGGDVGAGSVLATKLPAPSWMSTEIVWPV